jgi:uncharacterized protein YunC (DUF1805 family)
MKQVDIDIEGKTVSGLEVALPGAPLVLASARRGFVMCGYLNIETADKLGVAAAMVRGVSTVDDLLAASIQAVSKEAAHLGVLVGQTGRQALGKLI